MKLSSQEEYGLRCLLHLARHDLGTSLTIPEISQSEGISHHNVGKMLRILRQGGFVESERGQHGGYVLARAPEHIVIADVLNALGGRLFDSNFCEQHSGAEENCSHTLSAFGSSIVEPLAGCRRCCATGTDSARFTARRLLV